MRRKFLSVVLCVCMMLTMAPFAFAEGNDGATTEIGVEGGSSNTSSGGSGGTTLQDQICLLYTSDAADDITLV